MQKTYLVRQHIVTCNWVSQIRSGIFLHDASSVEKKWQCSNYRQRERNGSDIFLGRLVTIPLLNRK